jgi:uncharacterized protein (UPF0332 family)
MPYADHLLEQAHHLAKRERKRPRQASPRRTVSAAYYALFHLLISEAARNWKRVDQRALLARFFEHGKMRTASDRQRGECQRFISAIPPPVPGPEFECMRHLHRVANAFIQAQQQRHTADYDNATQRTRADALTLISKVALVFESWRVVRDEPAAQAYLISPSN